MKSTKGSWISHRSDGNWSHIRVVAELCIWVCSTSCSSYSTDSSWKPCTGYTDRPRPSHPPVRLVQRPEQHP